MRKQFRKISGLAMVLCMAVSLFSGCVVGKQGREEQKAWVKEMDEVIKDDDIEYVGPRNGEFGQESNVAVIKSKIFPNSNNIFLRKLNGSLQTDYHFYRYREDVNEYIADYAEGFFRADSVEAHFLPRDKYIPLKDYSLREYIKEFVTFNSVYIALFRKDGQFPSDEEMAEKLLRIAKDRDEICNINVYCLTEKTDDWVMKSVLAYELEMKSERKAERITCRYKEGGKTKYRTIKENVTW